MSWYLVDDTGCNCRNDSRNDVCAPRHCLCKDCQPGSPVWLIVRIQIPTLFVHSFDVVLTFVWYVVPPLLAHVCIVYLVHPKTSVLVPSVSHPFLYTPVILTHMPYFSCCFFVGGTCNYKCHYSTSRYQRAWSWCILVCDYWSYYNTAWDDPIGHPCWFHTRYVNVFIVAWFHSWTYLCN